MQEILIKEKERFFTFFPLLLSDVLHDISAARAPLLF